MAQKTEIAWADSTFNPWIGCTKVSPACDHCYASVSTPARAMKIAWGPGQPRHRTAPSTWAQPKTWNRNADSFYAQHGRRQRVFCASLADVFDNEIDPQWREDLFALINATPNLDWLLLTKRIGNVPAMVSIIPGWMPANVWLGATVVNQEEADRDIPKLLRVPARVRFLSIEPMLGAIDITEHLWGRLSPCAQCPKNEDCDCGWEPRQKFDGEAAMHWVIAGGESGPGARPMHPDWPRSLRDQCAAAGVPYLFKQWGEWNPGTVHVPLGATAVRIEQSGVVHRWPPAFDPKSGDWCMHKVGKKPAGRLLDGVEHNGFPEAAA